MSRRSSRRKRDRFIRSVIATGGRCLWFDVLVARAYNGARRFGFTWAGDSRAMDRGVYGVRLVRR